MVLKVERKFSQDDEVNAMLWDMEYLTLILNFRDEYPRDHRNSPNDIRRFLMNIKHEKKKLKYYLPEEVSKKLKRNSGAEIMLIPLFFTLIKNPIKGRNERGKEVTYNRARGAVAIYRAPSPDIIQIAKAIGDILEELMEKKFHILSIVSSFSVIIGKKVVSGVRVYG